MVSCGGGVPPSLHSRGRLLSHVLLLLAREPAPQGGGPLLLQGHRVLGGEELVVEGEVGEHGQLVRLGEIPRSHGAGETKVVLGDGESECVVLQRVLRRELGVLGTVVMEWGWGGGRRGDYCLKMYMYMYSVRECVEWNVCCVNVQA